MCEKMAEILLQHGLILKPEDVDNPGLLNTAVEKRYSGIVENLLKYGADVNMLTRSRFGRLCTPLHSAVRDNNVTMAKLLINYGANVNVKNDEGTTPIVYAIEKCKTEMAELLLNNGADIKGDPSLLCTAIENRSLKIVGDLLKYGADVNMLTRSRFGRLCTPLYSAVRYNNVKMAKLLINYGANVNVKNDAGKTPVVYAIEKGKTEMAKLLLYNGADIKGYPSLLCTAVKNRSLKSFKDPLKYAANVKSSQFERRQLEMAKLLIYYGANVNDKDDIGTSPLVYAIRNKDTKMVELLLSNGADVKEDPNLLYTAAEYGCLKLVEDLLENGADVNMLTSSIFVCGSIYSVQCTPLHGAVMAMQVEMAKLLINYGANINIKDDMGRTPLGYAIRKCDTEMTKLLLTNGADVQEDSKLLCRKVVISVLLKQHIAKVKAAGSYVSERNLQWISNDHEINNFLKECEAEIEIMKSEKIDNSCASFYDILTKNTSQLAKNESIVQVLKSNDYKTKFPIYASMIDSRFRRGLEREELLEQVRNKFFHSVFESLPKLPLLCTEKIFNYLSNNDLRILLDT